MGGKDMIQPVPSNPSPPMVMIRDACRGYWLRFSNPHEILTARRLAEVKSALEMAAALTESGKHIAGFVSYEAAPAFDPAFKVIGDTRFPLLWLGVFDEPEQVSLPAPGTPAAFSLLSWISTEATDHYSDSFRQIKEYIRKGDTYQVNLTFRLCTAFPADPWTHFIELNSSANPRFGAYIDTGDWALCSLSPELFFHTEGNYIESRPMKGTAQRGLWCDDDALIARQLHRSEKNRAENVMIVDMVRNDIGKIADIGSVCVPSLFAVERHPTVWQMTSTVAAKTSASLDQIFGSLFPPASVTGAPKARATEIIAELESSPRRIYTGAIGFAEPGRRSQFSVAIRTMLIDKENMLAEYGTGGGIVWDSELESEQSECEIKTRVLRSRPKSFDLLETMLWTPADGFRLLRLHMKRLRRSAAYFGFRFDPVRIDAELARLSCELREVPQKIRLLSAKSGSISLQHTAVEAPEWQDRDLPIAESPIDSSNPLLYHKTTERRVYEDALASRAGYPDVLMYNERGEITESTIANVVVEIDGLLYTPPVHCGLLPGTCRESLVATGQIQEKVLSVRDLLHGESVYLVNSIRGMVKIAVQTALADELARKRTLRHTSP
jgi:para-aminobenzoate synthetase/4-amino-4-deoxychorismate lyase